MRGCFHTFATIIFASTNTVCYTVWNTLQNTWAAWQIPGSQQGSSLSKTIYSCGGIGFLKLVAQEVPVGFLQQWPCHSPSSLFAPLFLAPSPTSPLLWWAPWDLRSSDKGADALMREEAEEWVSHPRGNPARLGKKNLWREISGTWTYST